MILRNHAIKIAGSLLCLIGRYPDITLANDAMKKPANVEDLTAKLSAAATAPLVAAPQEDAAPKVRAQRKKEASIPLFVRLPGKLHARYEAEAVARTKASGKGVTVQQVIIEKLEGDL